MTFQLLTKVLAQSCKTKQMAGIKRPHYEMSDKDASNESSAFIPMFEKFREELDEHHDRRERVMKASKDITAYSKKV